MCSIYWTSCLSSFEKYSVGITWYLLGSNLDCLLEEYAVCGEVSDVLPGFSFERVECVQLAWSWKGKQLDISAFSLYIQIQPPRKTSLKSKCDPLSPPFQTTHTLNYQWIQGKRQAQLQQNKPNALHSVDQELQNQREELENETISHVFLSFYNVTYYFIRNIIYPQRVYNTNADTAEHDSFVLLILSPLFLSLANGGWSRLFWHCISVTGGYDCERKSLKFRLKMSNSLNIISLQMTSDPPKYARGFPKRTANIRHSAKENKQMAVYSGCIQSRHPKGN